MDDYALKNRGCQLRNKHMEHPAGVWPGSGGAETRWCRIEGSPGFQEKRPPSCFQMRLESRVVLMLFVSTRVGHTIRVLLGCYQEVLVLNVSRALARRIICKKSSEFCCWHFKSDETCINASKVRRKGSIIKTISSF